MNISWKRYVVVFLITSVIFGFAFWLSDQLSQRKIDNIRDLQEDIGVNILSTETRFALLEKTSCEKVLESKETDIGFNTELTDLAHRVKFMESQLGQDNQKVLSLKKYYTLLQIKDYLLTREFHDRCNQKMVSILYFHQSDCSDCVKQSIVLDSIANQYPEIRVYWLDKDIQTPALQALLGMFTVKTGPNTGPAILIGSKVYSGFQSLDQIASYIPEIAVWQKEKAKAEADKLKAKNATSTVITGASSTKSSVKK